MCSSLSALPSSVQLLHFSWRLQGPSILADLPISQVASQGVGSFPLSQLPLRGFSPVLIPFSLSLSLFFICSPQLDGVFLPLSLRFKVFCQCSVDVLCKSFYM